MTRSEFLRLALLSPAALSAQNAGAAAASPHIAPMLYGPVRPDTDLAAWFETMRRWGVQKWMSWLLPLNYPDATFIRDIPFLLNRLPEFKPYVNRQELLPQEQLLQKAARLSETNGLEFWCMLLFPIFPVQDWQVIARVAPHLFKSGKFDWTAPGLQDLLKQVVRALKDGLPNLRGVNIWIVEAPTSPLSREDMPHNREWEAPLVKALDEVTRELNIEGLVFGHHYLHTVESRRNVYEMMADFPRLQLMEDITWPAEDMLFPFLGYLPPQDRQRLFEVNPVALNFLLDTEYTGQGILPAAHPRWWKDNIRQAVSAGARLAMGRTFHWDKGYSDVNFNRLNAHMFVRLCYDPDLDARDVLGVAAREMFGPAIPDRLVDILWETEPVTRRIVGINTIDALNHSRLPRPFSMDSVYGDWSHSMQAIDDLFLPPGTPLYPAKVTDDLDFRKQWRWQNRLVSLPAQKYIDDKKQALEWVQGVIPEVERLSANLQPRHRDMFVRGYALLAVLAEAMQLYVRMAALHYEWAHAKSIEDAPAGARFHEFAAQWRAMAARTPEDPFRYRESMLSYADFLDNELPRISKASSARWSHY